MAFGKVRGNNKKSGGALIVLLLVTAVFIYFLGNAVNLYNSRRSMLTAKDVLVCAQNDVFDLTQCLDWLLDHNKKDFSGENAIPAEPVEHVYMGFNGTEFECKQMAQEDFSEICLTLYQPNFCSLWWSQVEVWRSYDLNTQQPFCAMKVPFNIHLPLDVFKKPQDPEPAFSSTDLEGGL